VADSAEDLWLAAERGDVAAVRGMLGAPVVQALLGKRAAEVDLHVRLALISASENGHIEVVQTLLAANIDVNVKGFYGHTALSEAVREGHLEVVKALLAKGADVDAKNDFDETALTIALKQGHREIVQLLRSPPSLPV
jgi:uncharacterized protein